MEDLKPPTQSQLSERRPFSGDLLREMREAAGLTKMAVAWHVGCTPAVLDRWEKGATPNGKNLEALGRVLRVPLDEFFEEASE